MSEHNGKIEKALYNRILIDIEIMMKVEISHDLMNG